MRRYVTHVKKDQKDVEIGKRMWLIEYIEGVEGLYVNCNNGWI